jgi:hypothetical protein
MGTGAGMDSLERRAAAMARIEAARNAIVEVAAKLTAAGADTSGLADPVVRIGEALAELAAVEREEGGRREYREI